MTDRAIQPLCAGCGKPVEGAGEGGRAVRCAPCFDGYLRGVDAGFLEHYAEFGARSRQVVAETCLRALVLANVGDRKLLGMAVYEQFVAAASDLIALVAALRARAEMPISRAMLEFQLDADSARRFFADVASLSGAELLAALDLPLPERVRPGLPRTVNRDVTRALRQALADLGRLNEFRDLGERALVQASDHFRGGTVSAERTAWLAGRELSPGQVASVALDLRRGRLDIAALRVDEERLAQVVDGIDVMTRLTRNLIYAFVTLHEPEAFRLGFRDTPRVRAG
jgi:hypothetical protein